MSIAVNGQSQVPPGFRFHPTEEELLGYYLRKKVANGRVEMDVIREVDLNRMEPWDIQEECRIGSGPQSEWYLFSHKDRKYPTGMRTNRATAAGFWKATGRDKPILGLGRDGGGVRIGMRKTLVFYTGRAPNGGRSDWIMYEYRLDTDEQQCQGRAPTGRQSRRPDDCAYCPERENDDGWVVCRVFKKKNYFSNDDSRPAGTVTISSGHNEEDINDHTPIPFPSTDDAGQEDPERPCKIEGPSLLDADNAAAGAALRGDDSLEARVDLPALQDNPISDVGAQLVQPSTGGNHTASVGQRWAAVDRFIASHLDGLQPEAPAFSDGGPCFDQGYGAYKDDGAPDYLDGCSHHDEADPDLWLLLQSSYRTLGSQHEQGHAVP